MSRSGEAGPTEPCKACVLTKVLSVIGGTMSDCYSGCCITYLLCSQNFAPKGGLVGKDNLQQVPLPLDWGAQACDKLGQVLRCSVASFVADAGQEVRNTSNPV